MHGNHSQFWPVFALLFDIFIPKALQMSFPMILAISLLIFGLVFHLKEDIFSSNASNSVALQAHPVTFPSQPLDKHKNHWIFWLVLDMTIPASPLKRCTFYQFSVCNATLLWSHIDPWWKEIHLAVLFWSFASSQCWVSLSLAIC